MSINSNVVFHAHFKSVHKIHVKNSLMDLGKNNAKKTRKTHCNKAGHKILMIKNVKTAQFLKYILNALYLYIFVFFK